MAQLKKTVLGKVSGAVGDIVFRQREGKNYIGLRPGSFIPGTDPASVARRKIFRLSLKAGSSINSITQLKSLWSEVTPSGLSPFNYIVKTNYRFVAAGSLTDLFKIVPDNGFGINVTTHTVDRNGVGLNIAPVGNNNGIIGAAEPNMMIAGLVFLSSPIDESVGEYSFIKVVSAQQVTDLIRDLTFSVAFTSQEQVLFDKYQVSKTFVALMTLDVNNIPVHYSNTSLLQ